MNLVICTSVGSVVVVTAAAAFLLGMGYVVIPGLDWLENNMTMPNFIKYAFVICAVAFAVGGFLVISHDIGCKVIHLTMRH